MVSRADHIAGLDVARLTPADIDYFFKTLLPRVPKRVPDDRQPVYDSFSFACTLWPCIWVTHWPLRSTSEMSSTSWLLSASGSSE